MQNPTFSYTDSHCHLNALNLDSYGLDLDGIIKNAHKQKVKNILTVCTRLEDIEVLLMLTKKNPNIWASVGVHPLDIGNILIDDDKMFSIAQNKKIVAIGETGLDFHYSPETKKQQINAFIKHLEVGKKSNLPIIVHTRNAKKETIDLIKNYASSEAVGVIHCFTEDITMAKQALDLGFYISFSGIVTFKKADSLREVAKYVPDDKILVETDSPYLAPIPYRGKPNQPSYVVQVSDFIANLRKTSEEKMADITTRNFFKLFSKAEC